MHAMWQLLTILSGGSNPHQSYHMASAPPQQASRHADQGTHQVRAHACNVATFNHLSGGSNPHQSYQWEHMASAPTQQASRHADQGTHQVRAHACNVATLTILSGGSNPHQSYQWEHMASGFHLLGGAGGKLPPQTLQLPPQKKF